MKCEKGVPKRVVIISLDAVGSKDLPFMSSLPNFRKFMNKAAVCANVSSVYPSVTYPAHTSIITGRMPKNHGVINNTLLQPERMKPDWMWQRKYISGTTLYDEMIKKGWKVASLLWPVTAKSKIQYNLPEIFANRPWENQILVSACNGSLRYQLELNHKFGKLRDGVRQPQLDNFVQASTLYTIDKYKPDMLLVHFTDVDTNRHIYGVTHERVTEALRRHDVRLGKIMQHLEKSGDVKDTTVVVLGDHYQKNTERVVYINYLLREKGLLQVVDNKIVDYQIIAKNCDGACYLYCNHVLRGNGILPLEPKVEQKLTEVLHLLETEEKYGTTHIYSGKEAGLLGADDTCVAMLEAREGCYYLDGFEKLTEMVSDMKEGKMKATHGFFPNAEGYKTFFMAMGCGIQEGVQIKRMNLCDIGVTLAELLKVDLGQVDGKVTEELLK